jgi:DNA-directed RNA polymerase specialized sigma24 family protein
VRQKQTRLTPTQVDDLIERRVAGTTIADLAKRFGIHRTTVMAHLHRHAGR